VAPVRCECAALRGATWLTAPAARCVLPLVCGFVLPIGLEAWRTANPVGPLSRSGIASPGSRPRRARARDGLDVRALLLRELRRVHRDVPERGRVVRVRSAVSSSGVGAGSAQAPEGGAGSCRFPEQKRWSERRGFPRSGGFALWIAGSGSECQRFRYRKRLRWSADCSWKGVRNG